MNLWDLVNECHSMKIEETINKPEIIMWMKKKSPKFRQLSERMKFLNESHDFVRECGIEIRRVVLGLGVALPTSFGFLLFPHRAIANYRSKKLRSIVCESMQFTMTRDRHWMQLQIKNKQTKIKRRKYEPEIHELPVFISTAAAFPLNTFYQSYDRSLNDYRFGNLRLFIHHVLIINIIDRLINQHSA